MKRHHIFQRLAFSPYTNNGICPIGHFPLFPSNFSYYPGCLESALGISIPGRCLHCLIRKSNSEFHIQVVQALSAGGGVSSTARHSAGGNRAHFPPARISPLQDSRKNPPAHPPPSPPRARGPFRTAEPGSRWPRPGPFPGAPPSQLPDRLGPRSGWPPCRPPAAIRC